MINNSGIKPHPTYTMEVTATRQDWEQIKLGEVYTQVPGEAMSQGQLIGILNRAWNLLGGTTSFGDQ
jgi:hypothetical protein